MNAGHSYNWEHGWRIVFDFPNNLSSNHARMRPSEMPVEIFGCSPPNSIGLLVQIQRHRVQLHRRQLNQHRAEVVGKVGGGLLQWPSARLLPLMEISPTW